MKDCEKCGTQIAEDAVSYKKCHTNQEVKESPAHSSNADNTTTQNESDAPKLSEICEPAKREIRGWVMALLLVVCTPLVLGDFIDFLPKVIFLVVFICTQFVVLMLLWKRCNWNFWVKIGIIGAFITMNIIYLYA